MTRASSKTDAARALHNRGVAHDQSGEYERAVDCYRAAIVADPDQLISQKALASLLLDQGEHDEARRLYRELLRRTPDDVDAHFAHSRLVRYEHDDPLLLPLQRMGEHADRLPPEQQVKLAFTIGKANEDIGDFEAAFHAFAAGNAIHYRMTPFDEAGNYAMLDDVERCFDGTFVSRFDVGDESEITPIFVLGMPRSGSTLVEQMLVTHDHVAAAGEVKYLQQVIQSHLIGEWQTFGNAVGHWDEPALERAASKYLQQLARHADGCRLVVDKLPGNFAFIGLIASMLPNAKIVHTSRHPMATIWSNFSTLFADGLNFTYNLDVMSRYFLRYRRLMAHWDNVLANGAVHTVAYESLVNEPEATLRELLGYLDLPWQSSCLDFHTTAREVRTASVAQVRQPLYTSAIDRWRKYREWLGTAEESLAAAAVDL